MTLLPQTQTKTIDDGSAIHMGTPSHTLRVTMPLWRDPFLWLAVLLSIFAIAPFLLPGYFWGANDARHHVYFLFEYDRVVQDGIWWPRWSPDFAFGYGYPFFNIYGPLSHFLAELLVHFGHVGYTTAVESIFVLSIGASAAAMYAFVRSWQGRASGLVAAVVYTYIPYHLLNLYVRANLAESMAFVWMPLCLWTVRQATIRRGYRWLVGVAVSYAGLMLTSNLIIVLFTPLLGLYTLLLVLVYSRPNTEVGLSGRIPWQTRLWAWVSTALMPGLGLLAGIGLSTIFWLPMLLERQYVRVDQWFGGRYDYRDHFLYFFQLFSPRWGFGTSEAGPNDTMGFQLGAAGLILATVGVMLIWTLVRRQRWEIACFVLVAVVATFFSLTWGAFLWQLPLIGSVLQSAQFPWRWLSVTVLCISVLSGLALHRRLVTGTRYLTLPLLTVLIVVILSSYPYLQVQISEPAEGPVSLAGLMRFQQSSDEMTGSTAWVKEIPTWSDAADYYISQDQRGEPVQPVDSLLDTSAPGFDYETLGGGTVAHSTVMEEVYFCTDYNRAERSCSPRDDKVLVFNQFYYPGWRAYLLDGEHGAPIQELEVIPEETGTLGRMTVPVPPVGEGYILLRFEDTAPRIIGRQVSLATIVLLGLGFFAQFLRPWLRRKG
ncbi:MAG: hypothetical protein KDE19_07235 [Caldilineaceae bacterium]|nr:hypothetical protein [Caldilineaceae bacterium]